MQTASADRTIVHYGFAVHDGQYIPANLGACCMQFIVYARINHWMTKLHILIRMDVRSVPYYDNSIFYFSGSNAFLICILEKLESIENDEAGRFV